MLWDGISGLSSLSEETWKISLTIIDDIKKVAHSAHLCLDPEC